ncbi:hypothetical protein Hanom_Chr10g00944401 [Helianthus anomalus]
MLAAMETATKSASPWQTAIATRPAGSRAASAVNLAAQNQQLIYVQNMKFAWEIIVSKLEIEKYILNTESNGGADTREDEEKGGDELCNVGFDGAQAKGIIKTTKCNSRHFVFSKLK